MNQSKGREVFGQQYVWKAGCTGMRLEGRICLTKLSNGEYHLTIKIKAIQRLPPQLTDRPGSLLSYSSSVQCNQTETQKYCQCMFHALFSTDSSISNRTIYGIHSYISSIQRSGTRRVCCSENRVNVDRG